MIIRRFEERDYEPLCRLLSDPEVMRYLEEPFDAQKALSFLMETGMSDEPRTYAVDLEDEFIGYVIFHEYDESGMEIGWVLFKEYWGKGIASELTDMLMEKGRQMKKDLVIECVPEQEVTRQIALHRGFKYMGEDDGLMIYRYRFGTIGHEDAIC